MKIQPGTYLKELKEFAIQYMSPHEANYTFTNSGAINYFPFLAKVLLSEYSILDDEKFKNITLGLVEYGLNTHTTIINHFFFDKLKSKITSPIDLYIQLSEDYGSEYFLERIFNRKTEPVLPEKELVQNYSNLSNIVSFPKDPKELDLFIGLKEFNYHLISDFSNNSDSHNFVSTNFVSHLMTLQLGTYEDINDFEPKIKELFEPIIQKFVSLKPQSIEEIYEFNKHNPFTKELIRYYPTLSEESLSNSEYQISSLPWAYILYLKHAKELILATSNIEYQKFVYEKLELPFSLSKIEISYNNRVPLEERIKKTQVLEDLHTHLPTLKSFKSKIEDENTDAQGQYHQVIYETFKNLYQHLNPIIQNIVSNDDSVFFDDATYVLDNFDDMLNQPILIKEFFFDANLSKFYHIKSEEVSYDKLADKILNIALHNQHNVLEKGNLLQEIQYMFPVENITVENMINNDTPSNNIILNLTQRVSLLTYFEEDQYLSFDQDDLFDIFLDEIEFLTYEDNIEITSVFSNLLNQETEDSKNQYNNPMIKHLSQVLYDYDKKMGIDEEILNSIYSKLLEQSISQKAQVNNTNIKALKF